MWTWVPLKCEGGIFINVSFTSLSVVDLHGFQDLVQIGRKVNWTYISEATSAWHICRTSLCKHWKILLVCGFRGFKIRS